MEYLLVPSFAGFIDLRRYANEWVWSVGGIDTDRGKRITRTKAGSKVTISSKLS
jgi:hypothetical protein